MPTLFFTTTKATRTQMALLHNALICPDDICVDEIPVKMAMGWNVVADMRSAGVGYRLPEGVDIVFHKECPDDGPLRVQCEGRNYQFVKGPQGPKGPRA